MGGMIKIVIQVGGKPIEMTAEEARAMRDQLNGLFGSASRFSIPPEIKPPVSDPPPFLPKYTIGLGEILCCDGK